MPNPDEYQSSAEIEARLAAEKEAASRASIEAYEREEDAQRSKIRSWLASKTDADAPYWIEWHKGSAERKARRKGRLLRRSRAELKKQKRDVEVVGGWYISRLYWQNIADEVHWSPGVLDLKGRVGSGTLYKDDHLVKCYVEDSNHERCNLLDSSDPCRGVFVLGRVVEFIDAQKKEAQE